MKSVEINVQKDHLESLCKAKSYIDGLAELLWNSLDADAKNIHISYRNNQLGGIDFIEVKDDGHGISYEIAERVFANVGGSNKKEYRTIVLITGFIMDKRVKDDLRLSKSVNI